MASQGYGGTFENGHLFRGYKDIFGLFEGNKGENAKYCTARFAPFTEIVQLLFCFVFHQLVTLFVYHHYTSNLDNSCFILGRSRTNRKLKLFLYL